MDTVTTTPHICDSDAPTDPPHPPADPAAPPPDQLGLNRGPLTHPLPQPLGGTAVRVGEETTPAAAADALHQSVRPPQRSLMICLSISGKASTEEVATAKGRLVQSPRCRNQSCSRLVQDERQAQLDRCHPSHSSCCVELNMPETKDGQNTWAPQRDDIQCD
eukprot:3078127-Amphidinium_carterae.2